MKGSLGKLEELAKLRFELHVAKLRPLAQQEASIRRAIDELRCDPSSESVAANAKLIRAFGGFACLEVLVVATHRRFKCSVGPGSCCESGSVGSFPARVWSKRSNTVA